MKNVMIPLIKTKIINITIYSLIIFGFLFLGGITPIDLFYCFYNDIKISLITLVVFMISFLA